MGRPFNLKKKWGISFLTNVIAKDILISKNKNNK